MNSFAEIIVPLPLNVTFTYAIPDEMAQAVGIGHRVIVPFGNKKYVTGIVRSITNRPPDGFEVKSVAMVLDDKPIVRHPQLKFWEWIAEYYMSALGDVYKAAVPGGLKVESETFVEMNPDYEEESISALNERETLVIQLLSSEGAMSVDAIAKKLSTPNIAKTVNDLLEKGMIIISEKIVERYRSVKETYVRPLFNASQLQEVFALVKGAKKQEQLLMALIEMSRLNRGENKEVTRKSLLDRSAVSSTILNAVAKKGIIELYRKEINRFKFDGNPTGILPKLSEAQRNAMESITEQWHEKSTVLLHGVTSSGKTEIYACLIDYFLRSGRQVLYLVPEIALTTQLTRRLQRIFGNNIVVYHSKFSDNERVDIWKAMLAENRPLVILGARSSVFLPFSNLGLVIVDEEHEASYKQVDPAPRYNARDVALVLASMHGAKALLGSATPSIETYYKALSGKFGLVELLTRYNDLPLPHINIVDMTKARQKREVTGTFAMETIKRINLTTGAGKQAILFRNRRGFAPMARCKQCAWIPKCNDCDVSLTYHDYSRQLQCHYCGATYPLPDLCPQCQQPSIEVVGYGTERIENEIDSMFPSLKTIRMDLDTTRNKDCYETLIEDFSNHKADILVGTQMVTKGLDFKDVSTVAVLNADELINIPDFKAAERAFNMLEQVSGRAGRAPSTPAPSSAESQANKSTGLASDNSAPTPPDSEVLIQTYTPEHPIFAFVKSHDYRGFYEHEIEERKQFNYPPFSRIIYIYLKHRDSASLQLFSHSYATTLRRLLGSRVSGPDQPKVARVKSLFIQKIMIKVESGASLAKLRAILHDVYRAMASDPTMKKSVIYYDVDP